MVLLYLIINKQFASQYNFKYDRNRIVKPCLYASLKLKQVIFEIKSIIKLDRAMFVILFSQFTAES